MDSLGAQTPVPAFDVVYEELFDGHFWGFVRLAYLLGADDPEDVAQEAFVRLHRRRALLRHPDSALPYLRSTICNLSRNRQRHLRIARYRHAQLPPLHETVSAEHEVVHRESIRELLAAIEELSRRQREVIVLRYWLDLSERETAEILGVAVGTIKAHTARALAALTSKMQEMR